MVQVSSAPDRRELRVSVPVRRPLCFMKEAKILGGRYDWYPHKRDVRSGPGCWWFLLFPSGLLELALNQQLAVFWFLGLAVLCCTFSSFLSTLPISCPPTQYPRTSLFWSFPNFALYARPLPWGTVICILKNGKLTVSANIGQCKTPFWRQCLTSKG